MKVLFIAVLIVLPLLARAAEPMPVNLSLDTSQLFSLEPLTITAPRVKQEDQIDPRINGNAGTFFGSTSDTFRITATGRVGRLEKTVTAVIRYDDALGKLLYWKED